MVPNQSCFYYDRLLGRGGSLIDPCLGQDKELQGLVARPGASVDINRNSEETMLLVIDLTHPALLVTSSANYPARHPI